MRLNNTLSEIPRILDLKPKCKGFEIPANGTLDRDREHEGNSWIKDIKERLEPYVPGSCDMRRCEISTLGFWQDVWEIIDGVMKDSIM